MLVVNCLCGIVGSGSSDSLSLVSSLLSHCTISMCHDVYKIVIEGLAPTQPHIPTYIVTKILF